MIDGLVIVGGADIHPSFYGERDRHRIKKSGSLKKITEPFLNMEKIIFSDICTQMFIKILFQV